MELVFNAWQVTGRESIASLYAEPPDSSRAVMLGYDYWIENGPGLNSDNVLDPRGGPIMPVRFEPVTIIHLGGWYIRAMIQHTGTTDILQESILNRIESDVMTIFVDPENEETVVVWRLMGRQGLNDLANVFYLGRRTIHVSGPV